MIVATYVLRRSVLWPHYTDCVESLLLAPLQFIVMAHIGDDHRAAVLQSVTIRCLKPGMCNPVVLMCTRPTELTPPLPSNPVDVFPAAHRSIPDLQVTVRILAGCLHAGRFVDVVIDHFRQLIRARVRKS